MKYLLVLLILCNMAQLAVAAPRHEFAERSRLHPSAFLSCAQDVGAGVDHSERLRQQRDGQGLVYKLSSVKEGSSFQD